MVRRALTASLVVAVVAIAAAPAIGWDLDDLDLPPGVGGGAVRAAGEVDPTPQVHSLAFPVEGSVAYSDTFGACRGTNCSRGHEGADLMGVRLQPLLAANRGTIRWTRLDASGSSGNMLILEDVDGWEYWYIHINNDSPGTDDGTNPPEWILAPGVEEGDYVEAGDHIAFMGDSGNAEGAGPHVHFELHRPDGIAVNPWHSLRLSQGLTAGDWCAFPTNPPYRPDPNAATGYWLVDTAGVVTAYGDAVHHGDATETPATGIVVGLTPTPIGGGYWLATTSGAVLAFGDAEHHGDMTDIDLNAPIVGIDTTPGGNGYWMFAADGGVFSFGDARFFGSTGAMTLNAPVVGMAITASGLGYWLFAQDGGVFSFGDAQFYGSTGAMTLNEPVIGMVRSHGGYGYLLLGADGGAFTFGDARYQGSLPGTGLCDTPTARVLVSTSTGLGYWILTVDGAVAGFGDAPLYGDLRTAPVNPIGMAAVPTTVEEPIEEPTDEPTDEPGEPAA